MLLESYQEKSKFFNVNFIASAGPDYNGYRGELVLVDGEVGDSAGRRKPPLKVVKEAVLLAKGDKLQFVSGLFDDAADLPLFFEQYLPDLASDAKLLFFVVNLPKDDKLMLSGHECQLVSLPAGIVWNSLCEYLYLEKSDFKGQDSGEKIKTVYDAFTSHKSGDGFIEWDALLASRTEAKRATRGAL